MSKSRIRDRVSGQFNAYHAVGRPDRGGRGKRHAIRAACPGRDHGLEMRGSHLPYTPVRNA